MAKRCVWQLFIACCLSILSNCLGLCPLSIVLFSSTPRGSGKVSTNADHKSSSQPARCTWVDRVNQLVEYSEIHGDTFVPKRYADNPALGNWVNKQRQQYRKFCAEEKPCALNEERIRALNDIGFCWDGTARASSQQNNQWRRRLEELKKYSSVADGLSPSLATWMRQQRQEYQNYQRGQASKLDEERIQALNEVDLDWWKSFHQCQWEARYYELIEFRREHGDCVVPISDKNQKLANWVSNLRKNYNLKQAGRPSKLTHEQIDKLNKIGFVWNRWDYEYHKKMNFDRTEQERN